MESLSFHVVLEKHVYFSGETVIGVVHVTSHVPKRIHGITLRSEGVAHVHFTTTRQKTVRRRGRTETVTETEHHNQTEHYFTHLVPLLSAQGGEGFSLSAGVHQFNFSFQLPRTAPSSYEGRHGRVRYWIRVNLRRPGKLDLVYKMPFTVNAIADLNCWPELRLPVQWMESTTFGCLCCETGPLTATINLTKSGFVPGEQVLFQAQVDNQTTKKLNGIRVELIEETIFYAQGKREFTYRELTCQRIAGDLLGVSEWNNQPTVVVPSVVPSTGLDNCHLIDVSYKLKFIVETGAFRNNLTLPVDIKIGNVAFRDVVIQPFPTNNVPDSHASQPREETPQTININDLPPPSYEECVFDAVNVRDEEDSNEANGGGDVLYRPQYAVFRSGN